MTVVVSKIPGKEGKFPGNVGYVADECQHFQEKRKNFRETWVRPSRRQKNSRKKRKKFRETWVASDGCQ